MKNLILFCFFSTLSFNLVAQLDDTESTSNGSMTLGTGTGTFYQFAGDQRGTDATNQSQGGFGILSGSSQISPIIWMYGAGAKNAFQIRKKSYNSTVQDGTTLFHVDVNGNVGIGTAAPSQLLHINSGYNGLLVNGTMGGNNFVDHQVEFTFTDASVAESGVKFNKKNEGLNFDLMNAYYNGNEVFVIRNTGNVGIGIVNPDSKLVVDGKIRCEEVKVEIITGPDYVFESDYELRTLNEIKGYITENKHLPEIPSANEMETSGVDLGDMNMRLLKKIEELTLHMIEQNERIETLEAQNKRIQKLEFLLHELTK